jgi:hypothetical protein
MAKILIEIVGNQIRLEVDGRVFDHTARPAGMGFEKVQPAGLPMSFADLVYQRLIFELTQLVGLVAFAGPDGTILPEGMPADVALFRRRAGNGKPGGVRSRLRRFTGAGARVAGKAVRSCPGARKRRGIAIRRWSRHLFSFLFFSGWLQRWGRFSGIGKLNGNRLGVIGQDPTVSITPTWKIDAAVRAGG